MENEFVVISDFSENYSFLVQDEIQSFHWANAKFTRLSFILKLI